MAKLRRLDVTMEQVTLVTNAANLVHPEKPCKVARWHGHKNLITLAHCMPNGMGQLWEANGKVVLQYCAQACPDNMQ